ncbi:orotidine 5'-phosphate decarboxylase [Deltaproteobacteria bacterium]|nr:orotidine 5'-phosphate decarboxylase [Deltaproteobacteria bacterium]
MKPELVVALDFPEAKEALALADKLQGVVSWMKVGLELFTATGPRIVSDLKERGFRVFLDLKFHDIPNTVQGAAKSAANLGSDLITLHHAGGKLMAQAALRGVMEAAHPSLIFAVSILTSAGPEDAGFRDAASVTAAVAAKAREAEDWGLSGIVCAGAEAAAVKAACGANFLRLCPGIRMADGVADDQKRVMTPAQAIAAGADFLVMGRPITRANDPRGAALNVLENMASA